MGLTQEQVAKKAELHLTHISNLERGEASPGHDTLKRLAKGLDLPSPSHILVFEDILERRRSHA